METILQQTSLLENTDRAIICVDSEYKLSFFTKGAEMLFDLNKNDEHTINDIKIEGIEETKTLLEKPSHIKGQITTKDRIKKNIILSTDPKYQKEEFLGAVLVALENTIVSEALLSSKDTQKKDKKTFVEIRNTILLCLLNKKMAINQISLETNINWKTVEKHLTYFLGKKMVNEVFSSEYLRVFEISEKGKTTLKDTFGDKVLENIK